MEDVVRHAVPGAERDRHVRLAVVALGDVGRAAGAGERVDRALREPVRQRHVLRQHAGGEHQLARALAAHRGQFRLLDHQFLDDRERVRPRHVLRHAALLPGRVDLRNLPAQQFLAVQPLREDMVGLLEERAADIVHAVGREDDDVVVGGVERVRLRGQAVEGEAELADLLAGVRGEDHDEGLPRHRQDDAAGRVPQEERGKVVVQLRAPAGDFRLQAVPVHDRVVTVQADALRVQLDAPVLGVARLGGRHLDRLVHRLPRGHEPGRVGRQGQFLVRGHVEQFLRERERVLRGRPVLAERGVADEPGLQRQDQGVVEQLRVVLAAEPRLVLGLHLGGAGLPRTGLEDQLVVHVDRAAVHEEARQQLATVVRDDEPAELRVELLVVQLAHVEATGDESRLQRDDRDHRAGVVDVARGHAVRHPAGTVRHPTRNRGHPTGAGPSTRPAETSGAGADETSGAAETTGTTETGAGGRGWTAAAFEQDADDDVTRERGGRGRGEEHRDGEQDAPHENLQYGPTRPRRDSSIVPTTGSAGNVKPPARYIISSRSRYSSSRRP